MIKIIITIFIELINYKRVHFIIFPFNEIHCKGSQRSKYSFKQIEPVTEVKTINANVVWISCYKELNKAPGLSCAKASVPKDIFFFSGK